MDNQKVVAFVREHEGLSLGDAVGKHGAMMVEGTEIQHPDVFSLLSANSLSLWEKAGDQVEKVINRVFPEELAKAVSSQAKSRWTMDLLWGAYIDARDLYEADVKQRLGLGVRDET